MCLQTVYENHVQCLEPFRSLRDERLTKIPRVKCIKENIQKRQNRTSGQR